MTRAACRDSANLPASSWSPLDLDLQAPLVRDRIDDWDGDDAGPDRSLKWVSDLRTSGTGVSDRRRESTAPCPSSIARQVRDRLLLPRPTAPSSRSCAPPHAV